MFYYLIYSSSLTNHKDGNKKIITTLLYATIAYVLLHAFITLSSTKLINELRIYFWIILLIDFAAMYYIYQSDDDVSNWFKNIETVRDSFNELIDSKNVKNIINNNKKSSELDIKLDKTNTNELDVPKSDENNINELLSNLEPPIEEGGSKEIHDENLQRITEQYQGNEGNKNELPELLKSISTKEDKKKDLTQLMAERELSIKDISDINGNKSLPKRELTTNIEDLTRQNLQNDNYDSGSDIEMDLEEFRNNI